MGFHDSGSVGVYKGRKYDGILPNMRKCTVHNGQKCMYLNNIDCTIKHVIALIICFL